MVETEGDKIIGEYLEKYPSFLLGMGGCPSCEEAISILAGKKMLFTYIPKEREHELVDAIRRSKGHRTFPAIYIDKKFIGGCDDLKRYYRF
jgi:glutaredoxin